MHRRVVTITLALLMGASGAGGAAAVDDDPGTVATDKNKTTGSVGIAIGIKILDSDWEPLGDQGVFVVSLTLGKKKWPVHFALDYVSGEDEDTRAIGIICCSTPQVLAKSETTEWNLGVRRVWRQEKKFRPYAGGGIAFIDGEIKVPAQSISASDSTTGYWLDAGFRQPLKNKIDWGFDLRYSAGKINLGNGEVDAGGPQLLLYFGGGW